MQSVMENRGKIAIAMSGGVDSSVAALILKEQGYEPIGVNLKLWSCFKGSNAKTCCSPEDRRDASLVCERLGIPFMSIDMQKEFKDQIIVPFVEEYSKGRTPNPCIKCNTVIKFDSLLKWVKKELGIERIATGHYARIEKDENGIHLLKGTDPTKDQSYFLYEISPNLLKNIVFPLGGLNKDEIRRIAKENELPVAEKVDSQEICFIPDGDVAGFIEDNYPDYTSGGGKFINEDGVEVGKHRGTHAYTIGQRRGLGVGFGERKYVTAIRPAEKEVVLGDDEDLFSDELIVTDVNMIEDVSKSFNAEVKIRYRSDPVPAKVELIEDGKIKVKFAESVRAITPGQAAVFYDGDKVIGGGWIV